MTVTSATTPGTLYIVATPIGHLDDITQRAIKTLQQVDVIIAEDTRHSQKLLKALGIKKPMKSMHAHNEWRQSDLIINQLLQGQSLALISDAGTPLINDPGFPLVKRAHENNIHVVPIPGACALITALSAAGVPSDVFTFGGFLPSKSSARQHTLMAFKSYLHTLIFYESTHRLLDSISDIEHVFGNNVQLVLAKELTKTFECFKSGCCEEVMAWLNEDLGRVKGEFVLIIPARDNEDKTHDDNELLALLLEELTLKQTVKIASRLTGKNKNTLYQQALALNPAEK